MTDAHVAYVAGTLIAGFAAGVAGGTWLSVRHGGGRLPVSLLLMGALLALAAASDGRWPAMATSLMMAAAMGAANTIFQRDGEVSIGVTYMTGTLVKCVQRLTAALMGSGPRWAWLPYALLWMGLVAGACGGAAVYGVVGTAGVWLAVAAVALLAVYARAIGQPHAP